MLQLKGVFYWKRGGLNQSDGNLRMQWQLLSFPDILWSLILNNIWGKRVLRGQIRLHNSNVIRDHSGLLSSRFLPCTFCPELLLNDFLLGFFWWPEKHLSFITNPGNGHILPKLAWLARTKMNILTSNTLTMIVAPLIQSKPISAAQIYTNWRENA